MTAGDLSRVVVGVDASLAGLHALRFAVGHARRLAVPVHAVRAWALTPPGRGALALAMRSQLAAEAHDSVWLAFAAAMGGIPSDIDVLIVTPEGVAGPALVEYARAECDLLVVGDGRRGIRRIRGLGPESRHCLRHARCPVVTVPVPEWARPARVRRLTRDVRRDLRRLT